MPALFTITSMPPNRSTQARTSRSATSGSATDPGTGNTLPLSASMARTVPASALSLVPLTTTPAPSAAAAIANARPRPREDPVITIRFPSRCPMAVNIKGVRA